MGQLGQIVLDLQAQLGGEKGKALDQPLDIRIGRLIPEETGQLRILARELTTETAQQIQFIAEFVT